MNIENKKQIATILLAVGLGVIAVIMTSQYIKKSVDDQTKVISKEVAKFQASETQKLKQNFNKELANMKREIKRLSSIKTQVVQVPSEKKDIPQGAFSLRTPPGKRALTVMIDSLSAVGGLINAGDYVDVIAHLKVPDEDNPSKKSNQKVTTVLFQNIQVLAVGTSFIPVGTAEVYKAQQKARSLNITLALEPEEATLLTFAKDNGKLQLSLRSPTEEEIKIMQVASWDALSDYVLERQGTELLVPKKRAQIRTVDEVKPGVPSKTTDEVQPFIQIFKGGREL